MSNEGDSMNKHLARAKDYIGKFDVNQATSLDYSAKTSNNVALSAGLKLGF